MATFLNKSSVSWSRWIAKRNGKSILAFQFPEEGLDNIRRLWKQPNAKAGDWYVKAGFDGEVTKTRVIPDERFRKFYRRPYNGLRADMIILDEVTWNTRYSESSSTEQESESRLDSLSSSRTVKYTGALRKHS